LSWCWAHSRPKHVENRNKHAKKIYAPSWLYLQDHTGMHGQQNVKICDAEQAEQVHQYKNTKIKLDKSNAAIWCNKTCRIKQLIPTYVNIRVSGKNPRCQRTKNAAIRYRINQELKKRHEMNLL